MTLKTAWAQVFGVAAILAALAFAPSAAFAHTGHQHAGHEHAGHQHAGLGHASVAAPADSASAHRQQHTDRAAELTSAPDLVPSGASDVCLQGCCAGAPCHSCTACTLGSDIVVMLPDDTSTSHRAWNALGIAGCDPEGIRKPPKPFA